MDKKELKPITLSVENEESRSEHRFTDLFRIGRDPASELHIPNPVVSSSHAAVFFTQGQWQINDLESTNGTFLNRRRIQTAPLSNGDRIQLGEDGPLLKMPHQPIAAGPERSGDIREWLL